MLLVEALSHKCLRQLGAIARRKLELWQKVLHGPDVVEVPVREDDCLDAILAAAKGREIGDQVIDAEHVFVRELKSQIDDVQVAVDVDDEAVASDLLESSERIETEIFSGGEICGDRRRFGLWTATAAESGMLWVTRRNSISTFPMRIFWP